ncbi:MAG: DUF167 domain-containing protein [bacterium]|nr:DUF167 domain-containing protein [bacterium]
MKIIVNVKLNAKKEDVCGVDETHFDVWVKEPPIEGKANRAVSHALAKHFNVPKSCVTIVSGQRSKKKVVDVVL